MSKTYLGNVTYPQGRIDLNSSLNNIETSYAGTVAPSITQAYQTWLDTNVPITYKVRNGANSAWVELLSYTGNNASVANWFIDEDSFASNSATLVPSQQSVKSYVDNQISTNAHDPVTVTDSSEIDFTLTGQNITASLINGSIDETKLDTSTNASLDLADSSLQPGDIGSTVQAYSTVLQNTTASFTTADETKLDFITITQAVNLDQLETDIAALANGMTYQGDWNASAGSFPGGGTAQTGAFYYVSVGGTVDSVTFNVGDNIVATTDNASTTTYAGNWSKHDQTDAVQAVAGKTGSVTLVASDITDFDTEVSNNTDVAANTSARHAAVTLAGSLDYLTITGQQITRNAIDLSTDVTGSLPQSAVTDLVGDLAGKQPLDADLTAIAALAGTSGLLRKTAANTWSLDTATYLTSNQTITLTGDVTGSGTTSITTTLSNTGVGAGTYRSVTVDIKGRVTAGTNPTTLAGYGITDALSNSTSSTQSGYFGDIYLYDDSTPSNYLQITNSANLTALRTLNINVNDADRTLSLSGNLTLANNFITSGNFSLTLTTTGATNVTLPTSGTLVTTSNNLSVFAATTSAQLAGVISDETGTGSLVFSASPAFTGSPTAPTQTAGDNSTKVATTEYVNDLIVNKITVSTTAPTSPSVNDLWVDIN